MRSLIFVFIFLFAVNLKAQDRHYWDQVFGGKSALLGGIVVGSVRDYSATFYNPGAMGFLDKNSLSVNFNMYGIKDFSFEHGGGQNINSRYTRVSLYPASLAGSIPFLGDSNNRFSYMIYGNGYSYVRVSERYEGFYDAVDERPPSTPGRPPMFGNDEYLVNQGKLDVLLSEVTVGFGYARKLSKNVGIGATLLGAYRDQTKIRYESYYAFDTTYQRSAVSDLYVDIDFWAIRFSGKFGINAVFDDWKLGATITTPSLPIKYFSGGTDYANASSNNVIYKYDSVSNQGITLDILASDRQEGLPVAYTTPMSFAAGLEYTFSESTTGHFSMELFLPKSTYVVIQPDSGEFVVNKPNLIGSYNSAELLRVYDGMQTVFNFGFAVEHKINDKLSGYASFRTDFSNGNFEKIMENGKVLALGFTDFNIYHMTLGASYDMNDRLISLGFEYSHGGRDDFPQIFAFPTGSIDEDDRFIHSTRGTCKAIYNNFNIFIGVTQQL